MSLATTASANWGDACERSWMSADQFGVSTHYVPGQPQDLESFARQFDAEQVAEQAAAMQARWFVFTVQHQNWLLLSPNATFARIVGSDRFQSRRDVPADLIPALKKRGLKLMLYVNIRVDPDSHAPPEVLQRLGRAWPPTDDVIEDMAAIYREWSLRYGRDVAGWWIDSAGVPAYARTPGPVRDRWFRTIALALRAGNPDAMIAFNPGLKIEHYAPAGNYTAGESNSLPVPPQNRCLDGAQWHAWTYLGGWWGADGNRFEEPQLCEAVSRILAAKGAVTLDLGTMGYARAGLDGARQTVRAHGGEIDPAQVEVVKRLMEKLHRGAGGSAAARCSP